MNTCFKLATTSVVRQLVIDTSSVQSFGNIIGEGGRGLNKKKYFGCKLKIKVRVEQTLIAKLAVAS